MLKTFFTAVGMLLFLSTPVVAQDRSLHLVTSPLPLSLVTEPGTTVTAALKVKNAGTQSENLKIDTFKFNAYEESGKPALLDFELTDESARWVTFSESTFTLAPEEWKTITATFHVPETAAFGYYYAFVFSRAMEQEESVSQQTIVVGGAATLVLLEVRVPNAKREVAIAEFSTNKMIYEFLPTTFTVALENTGNVHVAPRGNIFIDQGEKHDIALLEVNPHQGNILPASKRVFEAVWDDGFPVYEKKIEVGKVILTEHGDAIQELSWDWNHLSKLRFGKYTAKLLLVYDDGTRDVPLEGMVTFWVVPWRLLLGVSMAGVLLFLGTWSLVEWLWRRIKKENYA